MKQNVVFYLPLSKVGLFGLTDCSSFYPPYPRGQTPCCKGKMSGGGYSDWATCVPESLTTRTVKILVGVSN